MTNGEFGSCLITFLAVLSAAHVLGFIAERLRQPRLIGEIIAGVALGPYVLGHLAPNLHARLFSGNTAGLLLTFLERIGLLLLMFHSGTEALGLLSRKNARVTAWIIGVGASIPFGAAYLLGSNADLGFISGPLATKTSITLLLAIAVAVTSIPVISRIFHDLGILRTRFADIVLGVAVLEDILLWAVLGIATALSAGRFAGPAVANQLAMTVAYLGVGLFLAPPLIRVLNRSSWNLLARSTPVGYACVILLLYSGVASVLGVNTVFAAFLAGFGIVGGVGGTDREHFSETLDAIRKVAFGVFIPIFFFMVGNRLLLDKGFSPLLIGGFLVGSSAVCLASRALAARLAGFSGLSIANLSMALNARGGPGIVVASVGLEAEIINGPFFTALVLTAVFTSQAAGLWLAHVKKRGWPLLDESNA